MASGPMTELDGAMRERLRLLTPGELTADQRELYDSILAGERANDRPIPLRNQSGYLAGPFNAMLHSPALGRTLELTGRTLRYGAGLPPRLREVAILAVAASEGSSYEWTVHSHQARRMGLNEDDLDVIAGRRPGPLSEESDWNTLMLVRDLLETGNADDARYAEAHERLGDAGMLELVVLVGHYRLLALILRVFGESLVDASTDGSVAIESGAAHDRPASVEQSRGIRNGSD